MSALMYLSVEEQKNIIKKLVRNRSKKFNKEYAKLLEFIKSNPVLKRYEKRLKELKEDFSKELGTIDIKDVAWERHEAKGADIERHFNKRLLDIKYEINFFLKQYEELQKIYQKYEKLYKNIYEALQDDKKAQGLQLLMQKIKIEQDFANSSEMLQKRQKIEEEINKLYELQKRYNITSLYDTSKYIQKTFTINNNQLEAFLDMIEALSQKESKRIASLDIDEKLKLKEAKVVYQRLLYSKLFKEEIVSIKDDTKQELQQKIEKLLEKEIIYKNEYEKLMDEYYNQEVTNDISMEKITKSFEQLGYSFEEIVLNEKGYIDTQHKEYKIAYRVENGKLSLAFTRFVDSQVKINEYEREKDKQMAKKWCSDFKKITELLAKDGVVLKKEMIKEPEEMEIRYEIVESGRNSKIKEHIHSKKE